MSRLYLVCGYCGHTRFSLVSYRFSGIRWLCESQSTIWITPGSLRVRFGFSFVSSGVKRSQSALRPVPGRLTTKSLQALEGTTGGPLLKQPVTHRGCGLLRPTAYCCLLPTVADYYRLCRREGRCRTTGGDPSNTAQSSPQHLPSSDSLSSPLYASLYASDNT